MLISLILLLQGIYLNGPGGGFEAFIIFFLIIASISIALVSIGIRSLYRAKKEHRKSIKGYVLLGVGILMIVSFVAFRVSI